MRKILSIEYDIPGYSEAYENYSSNKSFLDYDIIIFNPRMNSYSFDYYAGKPSYDDSSSRYFREAENHWNQELKEYLKNGKIVFIVLSKKEEFFIKTGEKQFSGTGKSRQTINIVTEKTNYHLISKSEVVFNSEGNEIKCIQNIFRDFYNDFRKYLSYHVYLKSENIEPAFSTKYGNRVIGGIENIGKGKIVYLPMIDFEIEEFVDENDEGKEVWAKEALKYGKRFIQHIVSIEKQLSGETVKTIQPDWVEQSKYELKKEKIIKLKIKSIQDKIKELTEELNSSKSKLIEEISLKDLLFETGKPLENAVIKGLEILGYKAENYDDGELELDQVITSPENDRFIGECEGKDNKAIDISKLRQLSDAINEDFEKNEFLEEAIGLLFGNPQRLLKPEERTEKFTLKCINAAKRRNIGLILTTDLFEVCKYLIENKDNTFKKKCRKAIKQGIGRIINFPEIPK